MEFAIPAAEDDYWDLNDHCLEIKSKIVEQEYGANVAVDDKFPQSISYFIHYSDKLILYGKLVSTAYTSYPYKAHVEKQLNYDKNVEETRFGFELYAKDEAGKSMIITRV